MTSVRRTAIALYAVAIASTLTAARAFADPPSITNLGAFYDPGESLGRAVAAEGVVAGDSTQDASGTHGAFRWSATGGLVNLQTTVGGTSAAFGISPGGGVVVGYTLDSAGAYKPFRWTQQTGLQQIGTAGGHPFGVGFDANDAGVVVGDSFPSHINFGPHLAFRWDPVNGTQSLGVPGASSSSALGVNSAGAVVGWFLPAAGGNGKAFIWTPSAGAQTLAGLEDVGSLARDISDAGYVTGSAESKPMLWRGALLSADLGLPQDYSLAGAGNAVNDYGDVVGYAQDGSSNRAILWPMGRAAINLDTWLDQQLPDVGANWTLLEAYGVTNGGLIVGYGGFDDGPAGLPDGGRAFLLDASSVIPEPQSLAYAAVALLVVVRRYQPARRAP
jgi:hypothetical protein